MGGRPYRLSWLWQIDGLIATRLHPLGAELRHAVRHALEVPPARLLDEAIAESRDGDNRRGVGQMHRVEQKHVIRDDYALADAVFDDGVPQIDA